MALHGVYIKKGSLNPAETRTTSEQYFARCAESKVVPDPVEAARLTALALRASEIQTLNTVGYHHALVGGGEWADAALCENAQREDELTKIFDVLRPLGLQAVTPAQAVYNQRLSHLTVAPQAVGPGTRRCPRCGWGRAAEGSPEESECPECAAAGSDRGAFWALKRREDVATRQSLLCVKTVERAIEVTKKYELTPANARDKAARALQWACVNDCTDVVQWLIDYFAFSAADVKAAEVLQTACARDNVALARWVAARLRLAGDPAMLGVAYGLFRAACWRGALATAQWLAECFRITKGHVAADDYDVVARACANGQTEVVEWLAQGLHVEYTEDDRLFYYAALKAACVNGHLKTAMAFAERYSPQAEGNGLGYIVGCRYGILREVCQNNHAAVAEWLIGRFDIQPVADAFNIACGLGHLETAQRVAECSKLTWADAVKASYNARTNTHDDPFSMACKNGRTHVAEWLAERFKFTADDVRANDCRVFRDACARGHKTTARWLAKRFALTADDVRARDNEALRRASARGHLETAIWLAYCFALTSDDARAVCGYALHWARANHHAEVAQWLVSHFGLTDVELPTRQWLGLHALPPESSPMFAQRVSGLTVDDAKAYLRPPE